MNYVRAQRLLEAIKYYRWHWWCFPKKLHVGYGSGFYTVSFFYKKKPYAVSFCAMEEDGEPDYEFLSEVFFQGYKRMKARIKRKKYE